MNASNDSHGNRKRSTNHSISISPTTTIFDYPIDFSSSTVSPSDANDEMHIVNTDTDSNESITQSENVQMRKRQTRHEQFRERSQNSVLHRVSVLVHNVSLLNADKRRENSRLDTLLEKYERADCLSHSVRCSSGYFHKKKFPFYSEDRITERPANQSEIIYSVFVNGKPVLATAAADDMKLLSEEEVSEVMQKIVYTKAERNVAPVEFFGISVLIQLAYFLHCSLFERATSDPFDPCVDGEQCTEFEFHCELSAISDRCCSVGGGNCIDYRTAGGLHSDGTCQANPECRS